MSPALTAAAIVLLHGLFILWAIFGALTLLWRRALAWAHLPAVIWAAYVEFSGRVCPLTPLENAFRRLAGDQGYTGGFIQHYVLNVIYPAGLTRPIQVALGLCLLAFNAVIYYRVFGRGAKRTIGRWRSPPP